MKKRKPYQRGAKEYLLSMKAGECRDFDGKFSWRGLQSIAAHLEKDTACEVEFIFRTNSRVGQKIYRVR